MLDDLKMIKKYYGEDMMHLCRELFSTMLETSGLLYSLMEENFAPSHFLCEDIVINGKKNDFKNYIYSLISDEKEEVEVIKNPFELMEEAGYTLYECKSEEDIQKFRKYYAKGEELCTFNGRRLNNCHVFFAVKKNVAQISRENFSNPDRQDEYGTSVISIQFTRGDINTLSIKNRYNHRVSNPDATFSNNLDNITEGLTTSFEKTYGLNINQNGYLGFEIPGYVKANDGRFYKYNYEIGNVYYCYGNIIIDNFEVIRDYQEKEKYIIADYFIIDLVNKKVILYDRQIKDSFIDGLRDIKNIQVIKSKENGRKTIIITPSEGENIIIEIDKFNRIVGYKNNNLIEIGNYFLYFNGVLENIELFNIEKIKDCFLYRNNGLINLKLPNLKRVGKSFLEGNRRLKEINVPKLEIVEHKFLYYNNSIISLSLPSLREVGDEFLLKNKRLEIIDLPCLEIVGRKFLWDNELLKYARLPRLKSVGYDFLSSNIALLELDLPSLEVVQNYFLYNNKELKVINAPKLKEVGHGFLYCNKGLTTLSLPMLNEVGDDFLNWNVLLDTVDLPCLQSVGNQFLFNNNTLTKLSLSNLEFILNEFLTHNTKITKLELPKLRKVGNNFLYSNVDMTSLSLPSLFSIWGTGFMKNNSSLIEIDLPNLYSFHNDILVNINDDLRESVKKRVKIQRKGL